MKNRVRRKALGVEKFSSFNKRSLEIHRAKKERKFRRNASLLQHYHKTLKQEGYIDDRPVGHERSGNDADPNEMNKLGTKSEKQVSEIRENRYSIKKELKKKKSKNGNSFTKVKQEAQRKLKEKEAQVIARKSAQKERDDKILQRRKRGKLMGKKTMKGQPVMKSVISNMLEKLQKDSLK